MNSDWTPFNRDTLEELADLLAIDREDRNVKLTLNGEEAWVDPSIADIVVYLNAEGYPTLGCGSGVMGEHYDFTKLESDGGRVDEILGDDINYILTTDGEIDLTQVSKLLTCVKSEVAFFTTELWFDKFSREEGLNIGPQYFRLFDNLDAFEVNERIGVSLSRGTNSGWGHMISEDSIYGHYSFSTSINDDALFGSSEAVANFFGISEHKASSLYETDIDIEQFDQDMRGVIDLFHIQLKGFLEHNWRVSSSSLNPENQTFEVLDVNDELLASGDIDDFIDRPYLDERNLTYSDMI
jgi:hypothetical protein